MSAQPMLFHHERAPNAEPIRLRVVIGAFSDTDVSIVRAGSEDDNAARWDKRYPSCAPHRISDFLEVIE